VAHNIKHLHKQQENERTQNTIHMRKEKTTVTLIKDKLTANNIMISKADKGNSITITYQQHYNDKVMNFISNNNFITDNNLTKKFQKVLRNNINQCQLIIPRDERWKYVNLNPIPQQ
jgi:hypothetical protein